MCPFIISRNIHVAKDTLEVTHVYQGMYKKSALISRLFEKSIKVGFL